MEEFKGNIKSFLPWRRGKGVPKGKGVSFNIGGKHGIYISNRQEDLGTHCVEVHENQHHHK